MKYLVKGEYEKLPLPNKPVYVFCDHATALVPWCIISKALASRPILLTLDNHTDIRKAFSHHVCHQHTKKPDEAENLRQSHCDEIRYGDLKSLNDAIKNIENDEQIDAAIKAGFLDFALVIHQSCSSKTVSKEEREFGRKISDLEYWLYHPEQEKPDRPTPPFTYDIPENRIFLATPMCSYNLCLESQQLSQSISEFRQMVSSSGLPWIDDKPFILDIDLDFFRSKKSIAPSDTAAFYHLLKNAAAITIALEPRYVEQLREDQDLDSTYLFEELSKHIEKALSIP